MRRLWLSAYCLLSVAYGVSGCAGPLVRDAPDAAAPADFPNHTAAQIAYRVAATTAGVAAFSSEARVEIVSPDGGQGVSASLRARVADSVFATLRGPLGIGVGRGLVTADSFFAHDALGGRLFLGRLEAADAYVPGAGEPGALARTLLGLLVPDPNVAWAVRAEPDSAVYVLTEPASAAGRRRVVVDPALWRVTAFEEIGPDGAVLTRRLFSAFDRVDGVVVPRRVVLAAPSEGLSVTVEHRQLVLNPPSLALAFRRPEGAEVIRVE